MDDLDHAEVAADLSLVAPMSIESTIDGHLPIIKANAHQPGSRQLEDLDHASEVAADLSLVAPMSINGDRGSEKNSLLLNENRADDKVECSIDLTKIGSSEPRPPSLLHFARGKVGSPESPPENDVSSGADNISRSSDHQVSDGNCGDTGFMCKDAISKMVVALESENPHLLPPRWIYAEKKETNNPIKIHPHERLSNGIETHQDFPGTFEAMESAMNKNDFAIFDTSARILDLLKNPANKVHRDPFLSPEVIRKRYTRLCTADAEHNPYANGIDLNKLRVSDNPLTMSLRSSGSKRKRAENESVHLNKAQETPTLSGVLRSLDAYCTSAFGEKGKNIFQRLLEGDENSAGDELRAEIKMDQLPHVKERLPGENEDQYYDRHAGRIAALVILEDAFFGVLQGITPGTGIPRTFEFSMASLLNADARSSSVQRQDGHLDKKPEDKVPGFAALTSISAAKDERANVGVVPKSASMIKKLLQLRRHFPEFCKIFTATLSNKNPGRLLHESIMQGKTLEEKQEAGWDFLCKQLMDQNPEEFKKLCPFEIELLPFEWLVFDSHLLHWGGPYRQSGHHNFRLSFKCACACVCMCVCVCVHL